MKSWFTPRYTTWLHHANPVTKLCLLILMFLLTVQTHRMDYALYQAIVYTLLLFLFSGFTPWKVLLLVFPFVLLFISASSTMILFGKGDHIWWQWGLFRVSEESFYRGVHLGLRSIAFAAEGLLFVITTPSVKLFYALMQNVKLRPQYAYSFMASIRLLPMVWEEFTIRRQALRVRNIRIGRGPAGWVKLVRLYAVPLLSQSIRRAHRVAVAMEAKQFAGKKSRTYYYASTFTKYDAGTAIALALAALLAYYLSGAAPWFGIEDVRYHKG